MTADWLLVIEAGGRVLRYATAAHVVGGHVYRPALVSSLQLEAGADTVSVTVVDSDLRGIVDDLDAGTATISLLDELGEVTVYATGQVTGVRYGAVDEPVSLTITRTIPGITLGSPVPASTARVDVTTWPLVGTLAQAGLVYPVIFGYPGWTGSGTAKCVVPCPISQYSAGSTVLTLMVVSEDSSAPMTLVRTRNLSTLAEYDQSVSKTNDLLGQRLNTCDFSYSAAGLPADPLTVMMVGYSPSGGGGYARAMYDVIRYVLQRWAPESVDWAKLPEIQAFLDPYNVDSWISEQISDPWVLIESLIRELAVEIRVGPHGRYLVARRYTLDSSRQWGALDVERDAVRENAYELDGAPENEITVQYQPYPETGYLSTIIACGSRAAVQPAGVDLGVSIVETATARRSYARYDRRPAAPIPLDWCWDQSTALAVGYRMLDQLALPSTLVSYRVRPSAVRGLREGDEVLITDPDRPWSEQPGIVDSPPVRSLESVTVTLRVPQ